MHDVIVVGGGPIGSHIAYKLSWAGYDVAVLEKKSNLGEPVCCTGIISQECFNTFNLTEFIILRSLSSARLFSPGGHLLQVRRPETQAYVIDRAGLDLFMARQAQNAGARYYFDCPVENIEFNKNSVTIVVSLNSEKKFFTSKCVVDAGGFDVRQSYGFRSAPIADFAMGVQTDVETSGVDEVEVYLGRKYAPGFFAWLVPTFQDKALVGLMARRNAVIHLEALLEELLARGKIKSINKRASLRPVPLKPLSKTNRRRIITVGSAAGQVKPLTGGGIYYGLVCADIAVQTLKRALTYDDFSARSLSGYTKEWHLKLGREIRTSYMVRKLFEHLTDRQMDKIFEVVEDNGIVESYLKMEEVSFDRHAEIAKKLLREKALSGIWQVIRKPFSLSTNN